MFNKLKIGIIGCGAIGSSLAEAVVKRFKQDTEIAALFDIDAAKSKKLSRAISAKKRLWVDSLDVLIKKSDLVIEAASAKASAGICRKALKQGRNVMIMSTGGLIGKDKSLSLLAKRNKAKVYIPSGALCGVDGLKAAHMGRIKKVTLITGKNPLSFKGVDYVSKLNIDLDGLSQDTVLFSGKASDAVKFFPQNINVAAVLSLAGIGAERTEVEIIASPQAKNNIHEVYIESEAGTIFTRTENIPHPRNVKTSFMAVLSAIATLQGILEPVKIGT